MYEDMKIKKKKLLGNHEIKNMIMNTFISYYILNLFCLVGGMGGGQHRSYVATCTRVHNGSVFILQKIQRYNIFISFLEEKKILV